MINSHYILDEIYMQQTSTNESQGSQQGEHQSELSLTCNITCVDRCVIVNYACHLSLLDRCLRYSAKLKNDLFFDVYRRCMPITVAARSKAWTVFARSNTGIVGTNPSPVMDVYVRLFCVCVLLCAGSGLATGWSPVRGVLPAVYRLRNWKSGQGPQER
jgi:hypothetical protein